VLLHGELVGKLLNYFGQGAAEAFPDGDAFEKVAPVSGFGSWLRNFRIRRGLQQIELAKAIGVSKESLSAYESSRAKPKAAVLGRLRKAFNLNGELDRALTLLSRQNLPPPDPAKSPLGPCLRYLRKRRGLTVTDLSRETGLYPATISKIERGRIGLEPALVGKVLSRLSAEAAELYGEGFYDRLIPVVDFASWLRNFRLRKGLHQSELARILGLNKVALCRYEKGSTKPERAVVELLKRRLKLNGELDRFL